MRTTLEELRAKLTNLHIKIPGIHFYTTEEIETEVTEIFTPEELDNFNYVPLGKLPQNSEAPVDVKDLARS